MFRRAIESSITKYIKGEDHKIFFIWGPRRSGKTTLLKKISEELDVPIFNFDVVADRDPFVPEREILQKLAQTHPVLLIDEVQTYPEATIALKILYDEFNIKIIATGSSELRQKSSENFDTLAGRFTEQFCLPLSVTEISDSRQKYSYQEKQFVKILQKDIQIFGAYPEIYVNQELSEVKRIDRLEIILNTYVLKDVVNIYDLKNAKLALDILTKIALQVGSEVSMREIASSLGANQITVASYIEIFIKNYILIALPSFKTNVRRAVSENRKLYFYDLGIRNALVRDFRDLELRPDQGGVFENFIVSEVEKLRRIRESKISMYFYREYGGQEVDLVIEDYKKNYTTLEIKSNSTHGVKDIFPLTHNFHVIDTNNYYDIIEKIFIDNF